MKSLAIIITLVLSSLAMAQDGYHSQVTVECGAGEACLINDGLVTKMIHVENYAGEIEYSKPSNDSFLADYVYKDEKVCFKGSPEEVCDLLDLMSTADGGDAVIHNFSCTIQNNKLDLRFSLEYYGYGIEEMGFVIKRCNL